MLRPLVIWPAQSLKEVSKPVTKFDTELEKLVEDMFAAVDGYQGVGLAAIQLGEHKRVLVYSFEGETGVLINPEIAPAPRSEELTYMEGCLSLPGVNIKKTRHTMITASYQDLKGNEKDKIFTDKIALIIQHEVDHLDGKILVDELSHVKRDLVTRKMKKLKKKQKKYLEAVKRAQREKSKAEEVAGAEG